MLRLADGGIRHGSVWLAELRTRDTREGRPEFDRGVYVEALVKVKPHAKTRLVDVKEVAEEGQEHRDHSRVTVRQTNGARPFASFAGVKRNPGHKQIPFTHST